MTIKLTKTQGEELLRYLEEINYSKVFELLDSYELNDYSTINVLKQEFVLGYANVTFNPRLKVYVQSLVKQAERERIATEKAEQERIAVEKAEQERIAAEKAEQERIAAEKAEQERIAAEKAEQERIAAEKVEQERIAIEKAEKERIAAEKAEKERIAAEKVEQERIAIEKAEKERIAAEKIEWNIWQQALLHNSTSSYQNYLVAYPYGNYAYEAKNKIIKLEELAFKKIEKIKPTDRINVDISENIIKISCFYAYYETSLWRFVPKNNSTTKHRFASIIDIIQKFFEDNELNPEDIHITISSPAFLSIYDILLFKQILQQRVITLKSLYFDYKDAWVLTALGYLRNDAICFIFSLYDSKFTISCVETGDGVFELKGHTQIPENDLMNDKEKMKAVFDEYVEYFKIYCNSDIKNYFFFSNFDITDYRKIKTISAKDYIEGAINAQKVLTGALQDTLILDTSFSKISILTDIGLFHIIEEDTTIPTKKSIRIVPSQINQTEININFFSVVNDKYYQEEKFLNVLTLRNPKMSDAQSEFELTVDILAHHSKISFEIVNDYLKLHKKFELAYSGTKQPIYTNLPKKV
jgi:hypothetical protein